MIVVFASLALSGCMPMGQAAGSPDDVPQDSTSGLMSFLPLVLIIVVFYFILIRPQNKKNKQVQQMRDSIKRGDWVTTIGGLRGRIVRIREDMITIEIGSDKVKLDIMKWGISKIDESGPDTKSSKKAKDEEPSDEEKPKRKPKKLEKAQKDDEDNPDDGSESEDDEE
jgi:preprotein translocase subunit YajC